MVFAPSGWGSSSLEKMIAFYILTAYRIPGKDFIFDPMILTKDKTYIYMPNGSFFFFFVATHRSLKLHPFLLSRMSTVWAISMEERNQKKWKGVDVNLPNDPSKKLKIANEVSSSSLVRPIDASPAIPPTGQGNAPRITHLDEYLPFMDHSMGH